MTIHRLGILAAVMIGSLAPAACGPLPPKPDTASLPPGVFSSLDQDIPAVQYAEYAFSSTSHTSGNPVAGLHAVLALDYIAGRLNTAPRWDFMPATTQMQLLLARKETRAALGIAPNASSQIVVDSLIQAGQNLQNGNQAGAEAALTNPAFTSPPDEILKKMTNLPYLQEANVATLNAVRSIFQLGGSGAAAD